MKACFVPTRATFVPTRATIRAQSAIRLGKPPAIAQVLRS
jgi:hypothetical protein